MDTKTIDTLKERGKFFLVGMLPIYARPLTLSQVIEIGEISGMMEETDIDASKGVAKFAFDSPLDVECTQEIALIALFRNKALRRMFGWYIKKKMNTRTLKKCMSIVYETFDFAFFFNASIFLRGVKRINGGKETEAVHGRPSEE